VSNLVALSTTIWT